MMSFKRLPRIDFLLRCAVLAAAFMCGCAKNGPGGGSDEVIDKPIIILYDNDVHCTVDGYAKIAGLRDRLQARVTCVNYVRCGVRGILSEILRGGNPGNLPFITGKN